jgi:predicted metal-binding membrane protein
MMLPSLFPNLCRYRQAVGAQFGSRQGWLTVVVGVGYFLVWTVLAVAIFPLGAALAAIEMQHAAIAQVVPILGGVIVVIVGALQFTNWKARHLACCREASMTGDTLPADAATAWRHGLRLGIQCCYCCANLMVVLVIVGIMDLRWMAVVTLAISAERLAPNRQRVARAIGVVVVAAGLFLIGRAVRLG